MGLVNAGGAIRMARMKRLRIGPISLDVPMVQGPISGYSDLAMRELARSYGAMLTFAGLMLDKSVQYEKVWRKGQYVLGQDEGVLGGQLVGTDPAMMAQAARILEQRGFSVVDVNLACPAPKVLARGRGGAFLQKPEAAAEVVCAVRQAVSVPVTVKLRSSYHEGDAERDSFWRICELVVAAGVVALVVHGRAVEQRYRGQADWEVVRQVKERFGQTTVIGSGDIFTADAALERLEASGADDVVVARGAIGNPWIYSELSRAFGGLPPAGEPSVAEVGRVLLGHFERVLELYPAHKAVIHFRKFAVGYCRRHPERKETLLALMAAKTPEQLRGQVRERFRTTA